MDGLAGIVYPDIYQMRGRIKPMLEIQKHRGIGENQIHSHRSVEVGACSGHLGSNENQTIISGFDGFLENEEELQKELKTRGKKLLSTRACDLAAVAYEEFGDDFLTRLKGDFSLFVYDEKNNTLLLAKDRIGKKPLYWYQDSNYFIFASELKALLASGIAPKTIAPDAFASYLYLGYIPQDLSPIQGISKLLPGHRLKFRLDGGIAIDPYWSLSDFFISPQKQHANALSKKLDELLTDSTKKLIPNEGLLECCLSGGLGSASVAHYIRKNSELKRTIGLTATFENINPEDKETSQEVAEALDIPHFSHTITPNDFIEEFATFAWHLDEPLADPSSLLGWTLSKMVKEKAITPSPAMFTGMGSDELLAGHSRYTTQEHKTSKIKTFSNNLLNSLCKALTPLAKIFNVNWAFDLIRFSKKNSYQMQYLEENALFSKEEMELASPDFARYFDPEVFLSKFHKLSKIHSPVSTVLYFDLKTRLADCFLLQFERSTAAFGIHFYTPFLEKEVVEFCASLPNPDTLEESRAFFLLKSIMQKIYPEKVINRPKRTRFNFLESWPENNDFNALFDSLQNSHLVELGMIDPEWLKEALKTKEQKKKNFRWLYAFLCFEVWYRLYIVRPLELSAPKISLTQLLLNK